MRTINAQPEPTGLPRSSSAGRTGVLLLALRAIKPWATRSAPSKRHVCCYCEVEITATDSHVEHMVPAQRQAWP